MNQKIIFLLAYVLLSALSGYGQINTYDVIVTNEKKYFMNAEEFLISEIAMVFKDHLEKSNRLYINLSIEDKVRPDWINDFYETYQNYSDEEDEIVLEVSTISSPSTPKVELKYTISGLVYDEDSIGIQRAIITAKGTNRGILSHNDGSFIFGIPAKTESLIITHKNYHPFEITIDKLDQIDQKDEFVVILKKKSLFFQGDKKQRISNN